MSAAPGDRSVDPRRDGGESSPFREEISENDEKTSGNFGGQGRRIGEGEKETGYLPGADWRTMHRILQYQGQVGLGDARHPEQRNSIGYGRTS